jgi:hypothetical protein
MRTPALTRESLAVAGPGVRRWADLRPLGGRLPCCEKRVITHREGGEDDDVLARHPGSIGQAPLRAGGTGRPIAEDCLQTACKPSRKLSDGCVAYTPARMAPHALNPMSHRHVGLT